jgi:hypothetical protein
MLASRLLTHGEASEIGGLQMTKEVLTTGQLNRAILARQMPYQGLWARLQGFGMRT